MERRLVLFFVIVAMIMWLSQKFLYKPVPRATRQNQTVVGDTTATEPEWTIKRDSSTMTMMDKSAVPEADGFDEIFPGFVPGSEETAVIATRDMELEVTAGGGTILSCKLPTFPRKDGGVVSLFPEQYDGMLSLALIKGGMEYDLSDFPYEMEIRRSPSAEFAAKVVWSAQGDNGGYLKKELMIPQEGYECRLKIQSRGLGLAGFRLSVPPGLQSTEKNEKDDQSYFAMMAGVAEKPWKKKFKSTKSFEPQSREGPMDWAGLKTKYFITAIVPDSLMWSRVTSVGGSDVGIMGMTLEGATPGGSINQEYALYMGPLDYDLISPLGRGVVQAVDMGNRYLRPIGRLVLLFLTKVHTAVPNYGFVIILFAVAMKILLHPLTSKSMKSMKKMQELQPKMAAIKEKYKNNQQKQQQETMKLYKEHGVNPVGGCLPMVFQMPIFFAMYPVLRSSIHLRGAEFIPGLVTDLSQGNPILPILMGITQFISAKMMATDNQNKMMMYGMPVFMTYIFFRLPAGLVLYWFTFNLLQILQQLWQKRSAKVA